MTATAAQFAANRVNAARSTGPRTSEGRAVSALNARKHGLRAASAALLSSESAEDWAELLSDLRNDLQPEGAVEEMLVERVALAQLKLQRAAAFEVGGLLAEGAVEEGIAKAGWRDLNKGQTLSLATKYARNAEASLYAALHELERRKARRALPHGVPVPASLTPIAVDLTVTGSDVPDSGE